MKRTTRGGRPGTDRMDDLFATDGASMAMPDLRTAAGGRGAAARGDVAALLRRWVERGWLRPLDRVFAEFLRDEAPDADPLLLLAAALASHQLGRGHVCLDLAATLDDPRFALSLPPEGDDETDLPPLPDEVLAGVTLAGWLAAMEHPLLVAHPDRRADEAKPLSAVMVESNEAAVPQDATSGGRRCAFGSAETSSWPSPGVRFPPYGSASNNPLVLVGTRLYLRRYWQYECDVRAGIDARLAAPPAALDPAAFRQALDALFPPRADGGVDWQKLACALVARSAFGIVTGGPGTGKTTTVVRLLALLQSLALTGPQRRPLRIRLAAPTGKAAARLNESIAGAVAKLELDRLPGGEGVRAAIPVAVGTLHRLLGSRPDTRHFRHDARNPLALDVLVVDEASMVDLEMMAAVLAALPAHARLVLLGDKDQLASVEAGAVLGELCARAHAGSYTPATRDWLAGVTGARIDDALVDPQGAPLDQAVAMLRVSHRFTADSGIGRLAEAVNAGEPTAMHAVLNGAGSPRCADLARVRLTGDADLRALVIAGGADNFPGGGKLAGSDTPPPAGFGHYLQVMRDGRPPLDAAQADFDRWARAVLAAQGRFQLLCALRRGPWGVAGLNERVARMLHAAGLIQADHGWYPGRPVLVTRNDYGLGLMNGDVGVTLELPRPAPEGGLERGLQWGLRVAFPAGDGSDGVRWVLPSRLQAVDTVYAMTVHKSQGSEFTHAALVLPDTLNPVLTRELVYTGITRARQWLTLATAGSDRVLDEAVGRRVLRASGLMAARHAP
ncbi:DNA helicase/exodeoxyribonuclease V, alpha subunit [Aromatoleum tolulyticum]|uniref:RecBCD enzyme subunit RecD n=1 Tax=Aromatoleum tolulyticum TaxID=34027 RepID=A0A1N7BXQ5_9RHOO|nr:exodeoxyribonuclease V subunit alpha [Aromatoleum tolulyticum]SIR56102.1 DNA helicase/exodeoxyribonuclease V, alpha subunit [Aromatoleum tolulyticum]